MGRELFAAQREFAARIRNPQTNRAPDDVPDARMRLYEKLFHANLERFLANGFPIAKRVLGGVGWKNLVRAFYDRHPCRTPYFREIGQEFLAFLEADGGLELPDFLAELAHYEAAERSLQVAPDAEPAADMDPQGDLLRCPVVVSPLIRLLSYRHRVHELGSAGAGERPVLAPTFLIACRRGDGEVAMLASNALTHRLLEHLCAELSGRQALRLLAEEAPTIDGARLRAQGASMLVRLRQAEVLLGVRTPAPAPGKGR